MFTSTAGQSGNGGQGSRDACVGKSAGDACAKPRCDMANPPLFCANEAGMITCKDCSGVLYCKRPNGSC